MPPPPPPPQPKPAVPTPRSPQAEEEEEEEEEAPKAKPIPPKKVIGKIGGRRTVTAAADGEPARAMVDGGGMGRRKPADGGKNEKDHEAAPSSAAGALVGTALKPI